MHLHLPTVRWPGSGPNGASRVTWARCILGSSALARPRSRLSKRFAELAAAQLNFRNPRFCAQQLSSSGRLKASGPFQSSRACLSDQQHAPPKGPKSCP